MESKLNEIFGGVGEYNIMRLRFEHPLKAACCISVPENSIDWMDSQFTNAPLFIDTTVSGSSSIIRERQFLKTPVPIDTKFLGNPMDLREEHEANVESPM